jgi:hypothetical protein
MSRLIEAGKILDNLSGMLKSMDDYDAVKKVINDMPTAYDVDKVVEQLEEFSEEMEQFKCGGMLSDMIEVVKAGGVDVN